MGWKKAQNQRKFETAVDKPLENIQKIKKNIGRSKNDSQKNIYSKNKEYDDKFWKLFYALMCNNNEKVIPMQNYFV